MMESVERQQGPRRHDIAGDPAATPAAFGKQSPAMLLTAFFDELGEIANLHDRRVDARLGNERADPAPPLDQAGPGERAKRLADRCARAAIGSNQLVLERNAMPRPPFSRAN